MGENSPAVDSAAPAPESFNKGLEKVEASDEATARFLVDALRPDFAKWGLKDAAATLGGLDLKSAVAALANMRGGAQETLEDFAKKDVAHDDVQAQVASIKFKDAGYAQADGVDDVPEARMLAALLESFQSKGERGWEMLAATAAHLEKKGAVVADASAQAADLRTAIMGAVAQGAQGIDFARVTPEAAKRLSEGVLAAPISPETVAKNFADVADALAKLAEPAKTAAETILNGMALDAAKTGVPNDEAGRAFLIRAFPEAKASVEAVPVGKGVLTVSDGKTCVPAQKAGEPASQEAQKAVAAAQEGLSGGKVTAENLRAAVQDLEGSGGMGRHLAQLLKLMGRLMGFNMDAPAAQTEASESADAAKKRKIELIGKMLGGQDKAGYGIDEAAKKEGADLEDEAGQKYLADLAVLTGVQEFSDETKMVRVLGKKTAEAVKGLQKEAYGDQAPADGKVTPKFLADYRTFLQTGNLIAREREAGQAHGGAQASAPQAAPVGEGPLAAAAPAESVPPAPEKRFKQDSGLGALAANGATNLIVGEDAGLGAKISVALNEGGVATEIMEHQELIAKLDASHRDYVVGDKTEHFTAKEERRASSERVADRDTLRSVAKLREFAASARIGASQVLGDVLSAGRADKEEERDLARQMYTELVGGDADRPGEGLCDRLDRLAAALRPGGSPEEAQRLVQEALGAVETLQRELPKKWGELCDKGDDNLDSAWFNSNTKNLGDLYFASENDPAPGLKSVTGRLADLASELADIARRSPSA